jgi:glycogen synthase
VRIVLLSSAFAPQVGGVEILTDRLARNLQRAGHQVEVWSARSRDDPLAEDELIDGLRVRRFVFDAPRASPQVVAEWPVRAGITLARMHKALRELRPDLLHVQCFGPNGVYATLSSVVGHLPLVVTLQGETFMDDHEIYTESLFLRSGLRLGLRRARAVTGCSQFTLEDAVRRFGLDRDKARVVFNGVDLDEVAPSNARPPFERFVFALGRVVRRKGFDLLVEAWAQIAERHQGVGLVLGGTGPELPRLRSMVEERRLTDRVHLAGPMSRADVAATMRQAEVFAMPSRVEAFGIVVLEAWRAGTPAIVTANGGTAEFVEDGITGLVVDPNDTEALAGAVERLLANARLRARIAAAAEERLGAFEWSSIRQQYEQVYEAAVCNDSSKRVPVTGL